MKVKLEQMDWENVKIKCKEIIREAMLAQIQGETMLALAEKYLKQYPSQQDTGKKGAC